MSTATIFLALTKSLDRTIHQGVRNLSTEQKPHTRNKNPTIQNHRSRKCAPFHTDSPGSDHRTAQISGIRRNINYCRPWVLAGRRLPPLQRHDHRPPDCAIILQIRLPLVRPSQQSDIRQRPSFYKPLRTCLGQRTGHYVEHVNSTTPPNGWTDGAKEPMGGAIPPISSREQQGVEQHTAHSDTSAQ
jgi:hypothetical protein